MIICLNFLVTNISMLIRLVLCDLNCWITKSQPGDVIAVIEKRVDNYSATDNCSTTAGKSFCHRTELLSLLIIVLLVEVPKGLLCLVLAMFFLLF